MCDSVDGSGARWTRSAVLHTLTISTTTSAAAGNLHSISSYKAEKVVKGSNYDATAGGTADSPRHHQAES